MTNGNDFAFATIDPNYGNQPFGLTKREYFAAMAMQGLLANTNHTRSVIHARDAVCMADALIKALNKEQ